MILGERKITVIELELHTIRALHVAVVSHPAGSTVAVTRDGVTGRSIAANTLPCATISEEVIRTRILAAVPLPTGRARTATATRVARRSILTPACFTAILTEGSIYN